VTCYEAPTEQRCFDELARGIEVPRRADATRTDSGAGSSAGLSVWRADHLGRLLESKALEITPLRRTRTTTAIRNRRITLTARSCATEPDGIAEYRASLDGTLEAPR